MFRVSWQSSLSPDKQRAKSNAAHCYMQCRAFSLGKPGRQGYPVNRIYLAYWNGSERTQ